MTISGIHCTESSSGSDETIKQRGGGAVGVPSSPITDKQVNCDTKLWMHLVIHCFMSLRVIRNDFPVLRFRATRFLFLNDGTWPWFLTATLIEMGFILFFGPVRHSYVFVLCQTSWLVKALKVLESPPRCTNARMSLHGSVRVQLVTGSNPESRIAPEIPGFVTRSLMI